MHIFHSGFCCFSMRGNAEVDVGPLLSQKTSIKCNSDAEPYAELLHPACLRLLTENGVRHFQYLCVLFLCLSQNLLRKESLANIHYVRETPHQMSVCCRNVVPIGQRITWGHVTQSGVKRFGEVVRPISVKTTKAIYKST